MTGAAQSDASTPREAVRADAAAYAATRQSARAMRRLLRQQQQQRQQQQPHATTDDKEGNTVASPRQVTALYDALWQSMRALQLHAPASADLLCARLADHAAHDAAALSQLHATLPVLQLATTSTSATATTATRPQGHERQEQRPRRRQQQQRRQQLASPRRTAAALLRPQYAMLTLPPHTSSDRNAISNGTRPATATAPSPSTLHAHAPPVADWTMTTLSGVALTQCAAASRQCVEAAVLHSSSAVTATCRDDRSSSSSGRGGADDAVLVDVAAYLSLRAASKPASDLFM